MRKFKKVRQGWVRKYGEKYLFTLDADLELSKALIHAKRFKDAEKKLLATYETLLEIRGRGDYFIRKAVAKLVKLYVAWNKPTLAAAYRDTLAALKKAKKD